MPVQQTKPRTPDEETDDLIRKINLYKDAELAQLARARRAEDALSDLVAVVREHYSDNMGIRLAQALQNANVVLFARRGAAD